MLSCPVQAMPWTDLVLTGQALSVFLRAGPEDDGVSSRATGRGTVVAPPHKPLQDLSGQQPLQMFHTSESFAP